MTTDYDQRSQDAQDAIDSLSDDEVVVLVKAGADTRRILNSLAYHYLLARHARILEASGPVTYRYKGSGNMDVYAHDGTYLRTEWRS